VSAPAGGLSQVVIRPAEPEDLPVLGRLGAFLVQLHHEFDPARFVAATPRTEHLYAAFLADQLRKPNGVVLVAGMGGEVLGYTYATVEDSDYMMLRGPAGLFHDLVVDPAHRGNGIGQVLLDATLARRRNLSANSVAAYERTWRAFLAWTATASVDPGSAVGEDSLLEQVII
jgi:GNAT superfamily N-acetyltransferase